MCISVRKNSVILTTKAKMCRIKKKTKKKTKQRLKQAEKFPKACVKSKINKNTREQKTYE